MARNVSRLREDLGRVRSLAEGGEILSLSAEETERIKEDSVRLLSRLESLEGTLLLIGLLGGTGVGKSTLMNALSGTAISSTSHRRPHTEKILVYRHREVDLPREFFALEGLFYEFTHDVDAVGQVVLCDFPDFDSIVEQHRETVRRFLTHLDMVLWVASPEKYADESLYGFLRDTPKSRDNYSFVLNKSDLFFDGRLVETGYARMASAVGSFREHLEKTGIEKPSIYAVSSVEALTEGDLSAWNQFENLRRDIFRLRNAKEVFAIKSANLDTETRGLLQAFQREIALLDGVCEVFRRVGDEVEAEVPVRVAVGEAAMESLLETRYRLAIESGMSDISALVGTGHMVASAVEGWRSFIGHRSTTPPGLETACAESNPAVALGRQVASVEDRIVRELLRKGVPGEIMEALGAAGLGGDASSGLCSRFDEAVKTRLRLASGRTGLAGRAVQHLFYNAITILLLLTLASPVLGGLSFDHWHRVILPLVSVIVFNLFTPTGLAALGSTFLLKLALGVRFYTSYRKSLRQRTQTFIESMKIELIALWEAEWKRLVAEIRRLESQIAIRGDNLSRLLREEIKE